MTTLSPREHSYLVRMCGGEIPSHVLHLAEQARDIANHIGGVEFDAAQCALLVLIGEELFKERSRLGPVPEDVEGSILRKGQRVICSRNGRALKGTVVDGALDGSGMIRVEMQNGAVIRISPKNTIALELEPDDDNV